MSRLSARLVSRFPNSLTTLLAFGFALSGLGCATQPTDHVAPEPNVLRVSITADAPPLIFEQDGAIVGLEAELARGFAAYIGKELRFVRTPWTRHIPAILNGDVDIIMSGMSITSDRRARIDFSAPYLQVGQTALIRAEDFEVYQPPVPLFIHHCYVGVDEGTVGDLLVQDRFGFAERVVFDSPEEGADALIDRDIDMLIHDAPIIWRLAASHKNDGLMAVPGTITAEYLAWGIRPGDEVMLEAANAYLTELRASGELLSLITKWIPSSE